MKIFLALLLAQGVILTSAWQPKISDEFFDTYCEDVKFPVYGDDNAAEAIKFAGT